MSMKHVSDLQVVRAMQAFRDRKLESPWPYEALAVETGQCEKVCFRAMERACDRGLIEYGVSLRTGWLTDKGRALLEDAAFQENSRNSPEAGIPVTGETPANPR